MKSLKKFKDAADKFLSGNYSEPEKKALVEWEQQDAASGTVVNSEETDLKDAEERILRNIFIGIEEETNAPLPTETNLKPLWSRSWIRVAASLSVAAGLAWLMFFYSHQTETPPQLVFQNTTAHPMKQILPDGSIVWLSNNSELTLGDGFNQEERNVYLKGEAFFKVAKNPAKPFAVRSGSVVARVLGTSFNVKTFDGKQRVEVSVAEGKVSVHEESTDEELATESTSQASSKIPAERRRVILVANQRAVFAGKFQPPVIAALPDKELPPVWKDRALIFYNATVREVIAELNRQYALQIQPESESLLQCRVKVDLSKRDPETALRILCQLIDAEFQKDGQRIILIGEGCPVEDKNITNE